MEYVMRFSLRGDYGEICDIAGGLSHFVKETTGFWCETSALPEFPDGADDRYGLAVKVCPIEKEYTASHVTEIVTKFVKRKAEDNEIVFCGGVADMTGVFMKEGPGGKR